MDQLIGKYYGSESSGDYFKGYKVICDFNNECVLAYSRTAPQQWVVWRVDSNGEMHTGKYFSEAVDARRAFLNAVLETRLMAEEILNIKHLRTEMLEGWLTLNYKSDTKTYDISSNYAFDFDNDPQRAWNAYLRELGTMTMKQIFEILNLEKMRGKKSIS